MCEMTMVDQNFKRSSNMKTWYWILANDPHYNLASDVCGENYNLDSQGLISSCPLTAEKKSHEDSLG